MPPSWRESVLGGVNSRQELEGYVAERAGGNPFFVEELLRALQETGGIEQRDGQSLLVPAWPNGSPAA